jgi:carboxymethylenebutenolidase
MGGSYAFRAAVLAEQQAAGCVMYYGFPEKDQKNIAPLQTDVLYIYGTKDKFIKEADVTQFETAVQQAGKKITVVRMDAEHAFANPSNPQFDAANAILAEQQALAFLRKYLAIH